MDEIVLYSTGCPKCVVLEQRLEDRGIKFATVTNVDEMLKLGMDSVPNLKVGDKMLGFVDAIKWVERQ